MCESEGDRPALTSGGPTLTIKMIRAGVAAYRNWSLDEEEVEALVVSIYLSMADVAK